MNESGYIYEVPSTWEFSGTCSDASYYKVDGYLIKLFPPDEFNRRIYKRLKKI